MAPRPVLMRATSSSRYLLVTLHCITLHYIVLHCITLHYIALYCIIFHYIPLYSITLHYIILHYITFRYHYLQVAGAAVAPLASVLRRIVLRPSSS
jgi:hypothetical protein